MRDYVPDHRPFWGVRHWVQLAITLVATLALVIGWVQWLTPC